MLKGQLWSVALWLVVFSTSTPMVAKGFSVSPLSSISSFSSTLIGKAKDASCLSLRAAPMAQQDDESGKTLNVVLFGVGDLRFHDHAGLEASLKSAKAKLGENKVLPLVLLDQQDVLPNIPGVGTSTMDTASMLSSSLQSLSHQLQTQVGLPLHVKISSDGVVPSLLQVLQQQTSTTFDTTKIHVCDLGDADNDMQYGVYAHLKNEVASLWEEHGLQVQAWNCNLRQEPWQAVESLPSQYPDYVERYAQPTQQPQEPVTIRGQDSFVNGLATLSVPSLSTIPTSNDLLRVLQETLQVTDVARLEAEQSTGLYGTHWGGMDQAQLSEDVVLQGVATYLEGSDGGCGDAADAAFVQSSWWKSRSLQPNPRSLEHATMEWMMQNDNNKDDKDPNAPPKTENLMAGELMTRYLAAPLLYGVVSPRQVWHMAQEAMEKQQEQTGLWGRLFGGGPKDEVLQPLVEGREWHRLFAAHCLRQAHSKGSAPPVRHGYWRYHGFLCRYGYSPNMNQESPEEESSSSSKKKRGIVLVHGFGASGSQFYKTVESLRKSLSSSSRSSSSSSSQENEAFVLDLLGFGESEKPTLSYNQYLWSGFTDAFIKEFCIRRRQCDSYIIGGNSIGGYTAMSTAADDVVQVPFSSDPSLTVSGTGAPGSGKCQGLVLMNSAGRILTPEMVQEQAQEEEEGLYQTAAQVTATNQLPAGNPPPRRLATLVGQGLLWYLRPRIREICSKVYPVHPEAVDDTLCTHILRDSLDPGAISVMVSGSKLPTPRTANEVLSADYGSARQQQQQPQQAVVKEGQWQGPVLLANGQLDPLNDCVGRTNMMSDFRLGITVERLNAGHCPHDEAPNDVARAIVQWMKGIDKDNDKTTTRTTATTTTTTSPISTTTPPLS